MRGHGKRMRPTVSSSYCFICLKVAPISFLLKIKTSSQAKRNKPSLIFTCQSNVYLFKISELGRLFMLHSLDVFFYNKTLKTVWNFPWIAGGLNFTILVLKPPLQKCKIRYNQFRKLYVNIQILLLEVFILVYLERWCEYENPDGLFSLLPFSYGSSTSSKK